MNDELITEANRAFYAMTAAEYDKMGRGMAVNAAKDNVKALLERIPGITSDSTRALDFAAGTGLLAMLLAPHCKSVTAVDLSQEMIDVLQSKLDKQEDPQNRISNIEPIVTDLLSSTSNLPHEEYDLVTCTNSYHHFADPAQVTKVLASILKPGGKLAIADLIKTETSPQFHSNVKTRETETGTHTLVEGDHHEHGHHGHGHKDHEHVVAWKGGFTEEQMREFFQSAGLEMLDMRQSTEFVKNGVACGVFLAIAQKPGA